MIDKSIGKILLYIRTKLKYTQEEVVSSVKKKDWVIKPTFDEKDLANWESGRKEINGLNLRQILEFYEYPVDEFWKRVDLIASSWTSAEKPSEVKIIEKTLRSASKGYYSESALKQRGQWYRKGWNQKPELFEKKKRKKSDYF